MVLLGLAPAAVPLLGLAPVTAQVNRGLTEQLALAERNEPYLMLEPSVPRLRLMCGGAVLREFTILSVDVGTPSVVFVRRPVTAVPADRARRLVALDPPRSLQRNEVYAPATGASQEVPIVPPDPSETQPALERYFLRLEDGFGIEVRRDGEAVRDWRSRGVTLRWKIQDMLEAAWPGHAARLRLVMPASEAESLYRAVPAGIPLVVL